MKNNLAQMAALLPELDAEHQRGILGGTAVPVTSPDYPEMIPVSTVVASTVVPCATPESTFLPTTTAFVPTPTASSVVTSIPVPTSSTLMPTTIPVTSATSATTSTSGDSFGNFCTDVWDWVVDKIEGGIDARVYVGSLVASSIAEGFAYMYLDFKYNGWDAGNGIGKIPFEEYMRVRDEYHAYHFSFDKGVWREESMLPEVPAYSDFRKMVDVVTSPGFVNVNVGNKAVNFMIEKGIDGAIHYGIDQLLDFGE